ncbi:hypothetical protein Tco_0613105 [Tanacetum coccineum]
MSMWIISRGVVLLILLMEYKVLRDFLLHRSSINNSARLSNKFGGFYFSFKFDISGLLHQVITTIAYRIRDKDTSQSKQNLQSSSMTFIHKTLIIPSVLDSCFISSTVSEVKREAQRGVKDYAYHKEKMMMCKQAEQGVPLQAEQADWLEDTDEEIDDKRIGGTIMLHGKDSGGLPEESSSTSQPLEQVDQNAAECVDERAALANLIANLTLDTEENKTVLKQLKKVNASLTQELEECKTNLDETSRALGEATNSRDSCLIALQTKKTELEKYTALNDPTIKEKKLIENCKGKSVETQFNKPSVVRQPNAQRIPKPSVLGKPTPFSNSPEMRSFQTKQSVNKTNVSDGLFKQVTQQNLPQIRKQAVRNTNVIAPGPSRNCPKHVSHQSPREKVGSNDMVHNYYLEKAKKSAQLQKDKDVNGNLV